MQEIHSVSIGFITAASGRSSGGKRDERKVPSHPQVSQARPPPSCIQPLPRMKSFQLSSIEEAGDLSAYDCVFLGFWIEGGTACEETANVLRLDEPSHILLCHAGSRPGIGARHRQHAKCQKPSPLGQFPERNLPLPGSRIERDGTENV